MGHGPAHPAPPPPRWGFVSVLACVVLGAVLIFPLIKSASPDSYLFTLGFICFFSPLVGWGVQVCFGKFLPRMGDWLPVSALLLSFCCGAAIFKDVVLDDFNPTYAREFRFNWFSIAGDGSKDATGARQLDDYEFVSQRGVPRIAARAKDHIHSNHEAVKGFDHLTVDHAEAIVESMRSVDPGTNRPRLGSFDLHHAEAPQQFAMLPFELREQAVYWLIQRRLEHIVAAARTGPPADAEAELLSGFESSLVGAALARLQWIAADATAGDPPKELREALDPVRESANAMLADAEGTPVPVSADKQAEVFSLLLGLTNAEKAVTEWCYYNISDSKSPHFQSFLLDMRKARDTLFQAFAIGVYIDNVTAVTLLMVTLLAFLIHLFSVGYMYGEIRYGRFMATINLFTAGMIGLVLANNFLWLFICWEIMGLCSYLLIGHYFEKKSAQEASMKAFFTTRIADTFMFVGMMLIFAATGTFVFAGGDLATAAMEAQGFFQGEVEYAGPGSFFYGVGSSELMLGGVGATLIGLLCFIGPAGKSAQFPFHVWLPDAMEGPTPVSAMIHAACMVSAGVYLTARLFPLFTPDTLSVIALIGGFTALAAGTVGMVQTDLKKVLAYSTISQLGYMFMGIGVGAWYPALFHMLTHAFFKALMFLGSGSVILGCHHEQEMPKMGGIWKKMPITTITFWIGNASIIGLPFFFAGYYSKEAILTDAIIFGKASGQWLPYVFGALGAGLTTFYMCRLMWLTFHGKPRDKHLYDHVKESPWTVTVPLVVIAVGALFISWPIGAHKDDINLGLTNLVEHHNAGPGPQKAPAIGEAAELPPQAANESWLSTRWRKPASAYSEGFLRAEYGNWSAGEMPIGYGETRDRIDVLYQDIHGRPQYAGLPAWKLADLVAYDPNVLLSHGDGHGEAHHAEHGDGHAPAVPKLTDEAVHKYHDAHHGAHVMAFMVALVMLALGIGLSIYIYLGPLANRDFIGHDGFRARVKRLLRHAYYMDNFYDKTLLRINRWAYQSTSWFDRVIIDGLVNWFGTMTRWVCRAAAQADYWGVDGSVRGLSNATLWGGRQASRSVTGRIQDYVFLLVAGVVVLFILIVMFRQ